MNRIKITACSPDPLMSNLKALGILRIVAEQKDPDVMASWDNDVFVLHTEMNEDNLVDFFLNEYSPTPIVSPWNNGSGFYDIINENIDAIKNSDDKRLQRYKKVIMQTDEILGDIVPEYLEFLAKKDSSEPKESLKMVSKEIKNITDDKKTAILSQLRNKISDDVLSWLDAAYVVTSTKPIFGTILGTGGNDGNIDISDNFMKWIKYCIIDDDKHDADQRVLIRNSLFDEIASFEDGSFAYFYPGIYSGEAVTGQTKTSFINPWDFILTVEGTLFFAGSITRRSHSRRAAFPFTTESSTVGYGTSCSEKTRGEVWIPLWDNPATYDEIRHVFKEGRAQQGANTAVSGIDFAKAVTSLGVEKGFTEFQRFGMFERKGQNYFANNIGRIAAKEKQEVVLFSDIEQWMERIKRVHSKTKESSKKIGSLIRQIDNSIIKFCMHGRKEDLQNTLTLIGMIERAISHSPTYNKEVGPILHISPNWINECYDGTPEFRLAVSLAAIASGTPHSIRRNLEPVNIKNKIEWYEKSPYVVWSSGSLSKNLLSVLERRCIDAQISNSKAHLDTKIPAPVKDIIRFIEGDIDHAKISNLLLPLSAIKYDKSYVLPYHNDRAIWEVPYFVPESYITLKSNFPPIKSDRKNDGNDSMFEPTVVSMLKAGQLVSAADIMRRRLQIMGYSTSTSALIAGDVHDSIREDLAASLLFPITSADRKKAIENVYSIPVDAR